MLLCTCDTEAACGRVGVVVVAVDKGAGACTRDGAGVRADACGRTATTTTTPTASGGGRRLDPAANADGERNQVS